MTGSPARPGFTGHCSWITETADGSLSLPRLGLPDQVAAGAAVVQRQLRAATDGVADVGDLGRLNDPGRDQLHALVGGEAEAGVEQALAEDLGAGGCERLLDDRRVDRPPAAGGALPLPPAHGVHDPPCDPEE